MSAWVGFFFLSKIPQVFFSRLLAGNSFFFFSLGILLYHTDLEVHLGRNMLVFSGAFWHININFLVRLLLGHPGNVPGTNRVCPRDKVGLSQGQTQVFSLLYTVEAQFVPGTNPVCPGDIPGTKGGRKSLCVKSLREAKIT